MDENSQVFVSRPSQQARDTADFSFHLAQKGPLTVQVNGETVEIAPDDGIFVNVNQMFKQASESLCLRVAKSFWEERKEWSLKILPHIPNSTSHILLHHGDPAQRSILDGVRMLADMQRENAEAYPFLSPGIIYSLFQALIMRMD